MATCAYCKTEEAARCENGLPLCLRCSEARSIERMSPAPAEAQVIRVTLLQELLQATAASHEAESLPTAMRGPDHIQRVKDASHNLLAAHNRLTEYLNRGIVPEGRNEGTK